MTHIVAVVIFAVELDVLPSEIWFAVLVRSLADIVPLKALVSLSFITIEATMCSVYLFESNLLNGFGENAFIALFIVVLAARLKSLYLRMTSL